MVSASKKINRVDPASLSEKPTPKTASPGKIALSEFEKSGYVAPLGFRDGAAKCGASSAALVPHCVHSSYRLFF